MMPIRSVLLAVLAWSAQGFALSALDQPQAERAETERKKQAAETATAEKEKASAARAVSDLEKHQKQVETELAREEAKKRKIREGDMQFLMYRIRQHIKETMAKATSHVIVPGVDQWMNALTDATHIDSREYLGELGDGLAEVADKEKDTEKGELKRILDKHEKDIVTLIFDMRTPLEELNSTIGVPHEQLLLNMGNALNTWRKVLLQHQMEAAQLRRNLTSYLPARLTARLGAMIATIVPNTGFKLGAKEFVGLGDEAACAKLESLKEQALPHFHRLQESTTLLHAASSLSFAVKRVIKSPAAVKVYEDLLKFGYTEVIGLTIAAKDLMNTLRPIMQDMGCIAHPRAARARAQKVAKRVHKTTANRGEVPHKFLKAKDVPDAAVEDIVHQL